MDDLISDAIPIATTAGISIVTLLGLYVFVPALRRRWFPIDRLRPGAWTGREVFIAFCIEWGIPGFLFQLLTQIGFFMAVLDSPPEADGPTAELSFYILRCLAISSPISLTLILGTLFALLFLKSGSRPHQYGLTWVRWPANLGLGLAVFLFAWPLIMAIQALAQVCFPSPADPFETLKQRGMPIREWLLFGFQVTIAAPIREEIFFRGILQGWLRRATLFGHLTLPFGAVFAAAYVFAGTFDYGPLAFAIPMAIGYGYWLYRLARRFELSDTEIQAWQPAPTEPSLAEGDQGSEGKRQMRERDDERRRQWADANATLAIYGTAMLFAIVHPWPAPLPLLPMGLALGWLSRRTQSLVGPIVFHAMFNLTSFIALYGMAR